jgi:lipopolysaccharide export system protein LptC
MKIDLFVRVLLIIVATLLAFNMVLPMLSNSDISYAANSVQYKVDSVDLGKVGVLKTSGLEKLLNEYSKEGWETISVNVVAIGLGGKALVVFKK